MEASKKEQLRKHYKYWMDVAMGFRPYDDLTDFVSEEVTGFGSTVDEHITDIHKLRELIDRQRQQGKDLDMKFDFNEIYHYVGPQEDLAIFIEEVKISMKNEGDINNISLRLSSVMEYHKDTWKIIHFHGSMAVDSEGDTWHTEEYKRKNEELQKLVEERTAELESSLEELKQTQEQLIHSEKMASLGELTAGIAHEIQNPLNFINNFSEINAELLEELLAELENKNYDEVKAIAQDLKENEKKVNHHGKRADSIVKGMLQHSRNNAGTTKPTDVNSLCDEYLRLAYHGLRAKDKNFNASLVTNFDDSIGELELVSQDVGRVILNLITNSFYTVKQRIKEADDSYKPEVGVATKNLSDKVEIRVMDNGMGIPENIIKKIFQPFFTTKPTGEGTGLGLSMSFDIIKSHGGSLTVESKIGEGSTFIIHLPKNQA